MYRALFSAIALPLFLAGCIQETADNEPVAPPPSPAEDTCGATRYSALIGQTAPVISVPANTPYRKYTKGDPVTMDYNMKRLNFEHDKSGKLLRVSCG